MSVRPQRLGLVGRAHASSKSLSHVRQAGVQDAMETNSGAGRSAAELRAAGHNCLRPCSSVRCAADTRLARSVQVPRERVRVL
jgi:hypothetical protein